MSNLKKLYNEKIVPEFMSEGYKNILAVPKVVKVVVNVGTGKIRANQGMTEQIVKNLTAITGQKPVVTKSKKAISGFKVREGDEVGLKVTLRGEKMYDFLQKLANITLPRIRDFRGLDPKGFGKSGNFSLGMRENIYFPESAHNTENIHPLQLTITTTAKDKVEGQKLLTRLGFPFKKEDKGEING